MRNIYINETKNEQSVAELQLALEFEKWAKKGCTPRD